MSLDTAVSSKQMERRFLTLGSTNMVSLKIKLIEKSGGSSLFAIDRAELSLRSGVRRIALNRSRNRYQSEQAKPALRSRILLTYRESDIE